MSKNIIQEKIKLLNNLDIKTEKFNKVYEEIIFDLVRSKELYSIVRKNNESNEGMDIFCGLNNDKVPSVWIFTEESIAREFTKHYKMLENGSCLYRKVTVQELTVFLFNAMFSGVSKLIIDEGENTLITNIYDFINASLVSINKQPILEKQEYRIMDIFNQMKYGNKKLWVIPSKNITGEELIYNNFIPVEDNKKITLYEEEEKCKEESILHGFEKGFAIEMEIRSLFKILENSYKAKIEIVNFNGHDYDVDINTNKVLSILQRMI